MGEGAGGGGGAYVGSGSGGDIGPEGPVSPEQGSSAGPAGGVGVGDSPGPFVMVISAQFQNCSGAPLPQESTGLGQVGRPEGGDPQTPKYLSYPGLEQEFPVR